jgi:hypothetical protein
MLLDARGPLSNEFSDVTGSTFFDFVETLFDVKGLGISESSGYLSYRAGSSDIKPVTRRSLKVHTEYVRAARVLDAAYHPGTPAGQEGPVLSRLLSFGVASGPKKGRVVGLAIGCFGELSSEFGELCTFIARNLAVEHLQYYDNMTPEEALNMFRSKIQRAWGHAAIFAGLTSSWIGAGPWWGCSHRRPPPLLPLATLTSTTTTSFMQRTLTLDNVSMPARGGPTITTKSFCCFLCVRY